jgi:MFS family permease
MTYVAQLVSVVGSASLGRSIAAATGSEGRTVWFTSAITISTAVLCPPISQAADYWGRKWLLVFFTSLGCTGSIVVSRANSTSSVLIGFILSGLAFGA